MRIAVFFLASALALLTACSPGHLSQIEAQNAMQARMERPGTYTVKVLEIHAFQITDCSDAVGQEGLVCSVRMDVSFTVDGAEVRDDAIERMRFVNEAGRWVAYPAPPAAG